MSYTIEKNSYPFSLFQSLNHEKYIESWKIWHSMNIKVPTEFLFAVEATRI